MSETLAKNLKFWHWYPEMLTAGLTPEQMTWQPEGHDTSIAFAIWHAYRAEDDLLHGLVVKRPTVFASGEWAARLPVADRGATPFGNGFSREQIGRLRLDAGELCAYADAVGESLMTWLSSASEAELRSEVRLPFFAGVYPNMEAMTALDAMTFFAVGHTSEHLGEVQMLKGMQGMKGAPL